MVSSPFRLSWQRLRPLSEGASVRGQGPATRFCLSAADLSRSGAGKSGAGGRGTARAAPIRAEGWGVRASYHVEAVPLKKGSLSIVEAVFPPLY